MKGLVLSYIRWQIAKPFFSSFGPACQGGTRNMVYMYGTNTLIITAGAPGMEGRGGVPRNSARMPGHAQ